MKSKKKGIIAMIVAIVLVVLAVVGYNLYRYPARFHSPADMSLSDAETERLRGEIASMEGKNVLVAYFSYSGNTRAVAQALSELTGADLFEIAPREDYSNVYMQSNSEIRRSERPELDAAVEDMDSYDIVFVGYPVWWHATPMIIGTFLESYDLTGVDVYPFTQSASMDEEQFAASMSFVTGCATGATVHDGLFTRADDTAEIDAYLASNGLAAGAEQTAYAFTTQETCFERDGMSIYAQLYVPEAPGRRPAVIYSHGFGGSGLAGTPATIQELQPGANVVTDALSISRNSVTTAPEAVSAWLVGLGL
ncbi:MAG TPA: hypothetical protein IAB47_01410 [Candidatus Scatomorpha merdigallinarum]|nr:hypothetical protein [Candidatus Scatomorpha merdigallinarum]